MKRPTYILFAILSISVIYCHSGKKGHCKDYRLATQGLTTPVKYCAGSAMKYNDTGLTVIRSELKKVKSSHRNCDNKECVATVHIDINTQTLLKTIQEDLGDR